MKIFFQLTFLEMKKIICRKYVFAVVLCLTMALGGYMYTNFHIDRSDGNGEYELYRNIEGKLTEDKYNFLLNERKAVDDYVLDEETGELEVDVNSVPKGKYMPTLVADAVVITGALEECDFILKNEKNRNLKIQCAKDNIEEYSKRNNKDYDYKIRFNEKVIQTYQKQPQIYLMNPLSKTMWYSCFIVNIHYPMILLLLILVITPLFVQEKETGMQNLMDTYEKGKGKLFFSKLAAGFIVTILTVVYFESVQLIYFKILIPELTGIGYPIQSVISECPFNITIGGFLCIKMVCVSIASLLISMVIMLFSIVFRRKIVCLGSAVLFVFATYGVVFYRNIWRIEILRDAVTEHVEENLSSLKTWLFTYLFCMADYYKKFECINICNQPFFPLRVVITITISAIIILIPITYFLYVRRKNRLSY